MTSVTKTTQTENAIITVTLTRTVSNKTAYADGYNIKTGREVYENYEIKIVSKKNGQKMWTTGKPGEFAFLNIITDKSKITKGGYARLGDAYISKNLYDIINGIVNELDTEVSKNDEQVALELAAETSKKIGDETAARIEAENRKRNNHTGWCNKCQSYCYGDCEA